MKHLLLVLGLLATTHFAQAQQPAPDLARAERAFRSADSLLRAAGPAAAAPALQQALAQYKAAADRAARPEVWQAYFDRRTVAAQALYLAKDYAAAGAYAGQGAAEWAAAFPAPDSAARRRLLPTLELQGAALQQANDLPGAQKAFEALLAQQQALYGEGHPATGRTLSGLGSLALASGQEEQAKAYYQKAIALLAKDPAANGAELGLMHANLGLAALRAGDAAAAARYYQAAYDAYGALPPSAGRKPQAEAAARLLGALESSTGASAEALAWAQKALPLLEAELAGTPELAGALYRIGSLHLRAQQAEPAIAALTKALALRQQLPATAQPPLADVAQNLGAAHAARGAHAQAIEAFLVGVAAQQAAGGAVLAGLYTNLAASHEALGQASEAARYLALAQNAPQGAAGAGAGGSTDALEAAGYAALGRGDLVTALNDFRTSLARRLAEQPAQPAAQARAYRNVANALLLQGDVDQALEFYQKGLTLAEPLGDKGLLAGLYQGMGQAQLRKGDGTQAALLLERALPLINQTAGERSQPAAELLLALADAQTAARAYDPARANYDKAIAILTALYGERHPSLAAVYNNLGVHYAARLDYARAVESYERGLALQQEIYGDKHPNVALALVNLAGTMLAQQQPRAALGYVQRAFVANMPSYDDTTSAALPPADGRMLSDLVQLDGLIARGRVLYTLFTKNPADATPARQALASYQAADALLDRLRASFRAEGSKLALAAKAQDVAEGGIKAALALKDNETAFFFAEQSRSGVLLASMSESNARSFGVIPDSLLAKEEALRNALALEETAQAEEQQKCPKCDAATLSRQQDKIFGLRRGLEALAELFEDKYPEYYNLKYRQDVIRVADVQAVLDEKTALVEYFTGEANLYAFVITRGGLAVHTMAKDADFDGRVLALRRAIRTRNYGPYARNAMRLYINTLRGPVDALPASVTELVLVVDGVLAFIPFEALISRPGPQEENYTELEYVLKRFNIRYTYSATLLHQQHQYWRAEGRERPANSYIAFAPVFDGAVQAGAGATAALSGFAADSVRAASAQRFYTRQGAEIVPLPGTLKEVEQIGALFDAKGASVYVATHADASEAKLKTTSLMGYRFVHFATHGLVNEAQPKLSCLLLAQDGTREDNVLYSAEVYNLRLNADLVALSACETGLGRVVQGEGLIGLTRGFLYAGARSVLVSLWTVADESTAQLMIDTYKHLLTDAPRAEALRTAKQDMIAGGKFAAPYYWSAFILVGQ